MLMFAINIMYAFRARHGFKEHKRKRQSNWSIHVYAGHVAMDQRSKYISFIDDSTLEFYLFNN